MIARAASGLLALVLLASLSPSWALNEEENLEYIGRIMGYLNNNYECTLPTFQEVDQLQVSFTELKSAWGAEFESRLSEDQQLAQRTLLQYWDEFQRHMNSAVIVRSAKKRFFLCKIEDYQEAKFGESVCTRIKNVRGPVTNRIFEKNPTVRYLKHLEDGEVP